MMNEECFSIKKVWIESEEKNTQQTNKTATDTFGNLRERERM